jgi:predicted enzyme related to lactoylglutathione lyase
MKDYDNFFLPVDDITSAKDYYMNILGLSLKFDFSSQGMIAFNVGDNEPAIILKDINKFNDAKPTTWFVVEDVNKDYEEMKNNGVNFLSPPFPIRTGMAVEFEDPFGNRLGITDYSNEI